MDERAVRRSAARLFAVLAVLVGLLAMHGLASTHHPAAATPVADHAATVVNDGPGETDHTHPVMQPAAADPGAETLVAPAGLACDDDCSGVAALCVAVLAGAALALLLARRLAAPPILAPPPRPAQAPAPPARHARGPDPVRELCVSRT